MRLNIEDELVRTAGGQAELGGKSEEVLQDWSCSSYMIGSEKPLAFEICPAKSHICTDMAKAALGWLVSSARPGRALKSWSHDPDEMNLTLGSLVVRAHFDSYQIPSISLTLHVCHVCRSVGVVPGGQWGGLYSSPMGRV